MPNKKTKIKSIFQAAEFLIEWMTNYSHEQGNPVELDSRVDDLCLIHRLAEELVYSEEV